MILADVDRAARSVLERYGFDEQRFEQLRAKVASGALSPATNVVTEAIEPPEPGDVIVVPTRGEPGSTEARSAGLAALCAGRIAAVVLAGGMATRFGGVVKGLTEAVDGRSFLEIKLGETARLGSALGVEIPVAVMTSFATDAAIRAYVAERRLGEPLFFSQSVAPRLRPDGELFRDEAGNVSLYGPGHGDLLEAIVASGTLAALRRRGVEHVVISNVDNLGARLDPVVAGSHLVAGRPLTVEVASRDGDLGGAPVRLGGRLRLLEAPCFPPDFDQSRIPVFNTNTATASLEALEHPVDLTWLVVEKDVGGRPAVQLEHLYHELSAFVETTYLHVPRTGPRGRFFPIKLPSELERSLDDLREMLAVSPLDL